MFSPGSGAYVSKRKRLAGLRVCGLVGYDREFRLPLQAGRISFFGAALSGFMTGLGLWQILPPLMGFSHFQGTTALISTVLSNHLSERSPRITPRGVLA